MISNFVLDREYLDIFLDSVLNNLVSENNEINSLIEDCTYFTGSVHSNNYFFSKNIQRMIKKENYPSNYVDNVYRIQEEKLFFLEEISGKFLNFLITHTSNLDIELDSHLKEIQEDYLNSNYGKQIRY